MGMDVIGKNKASEKGSYFRNNVWWWHPLWDYCCEVAPEICNKVINGHSNDGDGLGARDSKKLATILQAEVESGETRVYSELRAAELAARPDEPCEHCKGTGKRDDEFVQGNCNACGATGKRRPWDTNYPFSVENVQEFIAFLKECGGFRIC